MKKLFNPIVLISSLLIMAMACTKTDTPVSNNSNSTGTDELAIYKKVYGATSIYTQVINDTTFVVFTTVDTPDHKSPYYKTTQWESRKYIADTASSFKINPSVIVQQSLVFKIPLHPVVKTNKTATPLGPIGISLNGVPFFNQYAAGRATLTYEKLSFDQYGGHPQQQGQYHYHVEPKWLTQNKGEDALLGFLLDGFPVYGPMENGKTISNSDLDQYHGHTSATADYPAGIYHYHITSTDPYINGSGFYGVPGTVSQ